MIPTLSLDFWLCQLSANEQWLSFMSSFVPVPQFSKAKEKISFQANQMLNLLTEQQTMLRKKSIKDTHTFFAFNHLMFNSMEKLIGKNFSMINIKEFIFFSSIFTHDFPSPLFHMKFTMFPLFISSRLKFTCFFVVSHPSNDIDQYWIAGKLMKILHTWRRTMNCFCSPDTSHKVLARNWFPWQWLKYFIDWNGKWKCLG